MTKSSKSKVREIRLQKTTKKTQKVQEDQEIEEYPYFVGCYSKQVFKILKKIAVLLESQTEDFGLKITVKITPRKQKRKTKKNAIS